MVLFERISTARWAFVTLYASSFVILLSVDYLLGRDTVRYIELNNY